MLLYVLVLFNLICFGIMYVLDWNINGWIFDGLLYVGIVGLVFIVVMFSFVFGNLWYLFLLVKVEFELVFFVLDGCGWYKLNIDLIIEVKEFLWILELI